ncbi:uncharacterized protein [Euwallacea fornicatus]|uniref:uncharacterized protein isoform X2 n=1 Tax=Euwallacea fornicatus TaxID=995702 RepID=UPI00338ED48E
MITIRSENCTVRSGIKEVIFVTSGVGPVSKSTRISELPSLRYGPVGPKTNITGPLVLRRDGIKGRKSEQLIRLPRKVRFALPAPEGVRGVEDSENAASLENSEGILLFDVNTQKAFSQRPGAKQSETEKASLGAASVDKFSLPRRFDKFRKERLQDRRRDFEERVEVPVSVSPGIRHRVHPTGRYIRGTLSPTSNQAPHESPLSPGGQVLLRAARDGDDNALREQLRRALTMGLTENDLNATDSSGRTILSHVASNGTIDVLELLLQVPGLDPNKPDNEGNTPLHFAAQAGRASGMSKLLGEQVSGGGNRRPQQPGLYPFDEGSSSGAEQVRKVAALRRSKSNFTRQRARLQGGSMGAFLRPLRLRRRDRKARPSKAPGTVHVVWELGHGERYEPGGNGR